MNNQTTIRNSSRAFRVCALPFAMLVTISVSAASNSWTQATDEVWKSDTNWTVSPKDETAELFNAPRIVAASAEATPPVMKIVTPAGLISISGAGSLTFGGAIPNTQTEDSIVKAVLACLGNRMSSGNAEQHFVSSPVIGNSEVNLSRIPANTPAQNMPAAHIDAREQKNVARTLTGRLSGASGTELTATSFSSNGVRSSQKAGVPFFAGSNFSSNSGGGPGSFAQVSARKSTAASFTEKLEANTSHTQNPHVLRDNSSAAYSENTASLSEQTNLTPGYVTELEGAAASGVTGIASSIVQNVLLTAEKTGSRNTAGLAYIGSLAQGDGNRGSLVVSSTGYSITTGYQEVQPMHFASTTTTFGSLSVIPQSSSPAFDFNGTNAANNSPAYAAAASSFENMTASSTHNTATFSTTQFNTSQKIPTLRRAVSVASAPGDKTTLTFGTDGLTLNDNLGNPLSVGTAAFGDGMAVQIGYYDAATTGNNFAGNWVPMTGQNAVNSAYLVTTIGDDSGLGGGAAGEFYSGSLDFIVGDATRGSFPSSTSIPLSLRFYNAALISNATLFNTVSNDLWVWHTPQPPGPPSPFDLSLADSGLEWQGGAGSAFKTTLAIPEPTSALLLALGTAGLLGRRRRRV